MILKSTVGHLFESTYLAMLGLHWGVWDLHGVMWDLSLRCNCLVVVCGLSCSNRWDLNFPNQVLNLCPWHCKANSSPVDHEGSPRVGNLFICKINIKG